MDRQIDLILRDAVLRTAPLDEEISFFRPHPEEPAAARSAKAWRLEG